MRGRLPHPFTDEKPEAGASGDMLRVTQFGMGRENSHPDLLAASPGGAYPLSSVNVKTQS